MTQTQTATLKAGDIVRYSHPIDIDESRLTFVVKEMREDRLAMASLDFPNDRFAPIEVVALDEVEVAS